MLLTRGLGRKLAVTRGLAPRGTDAAASSPVALTIGNFDGVHLGHQAMLARAARPRASAGPAGLRADASSRTRASSSPPIRRPPGSPRCARSSNCSPRSASTGVHVPRSTATSRALRRGFRRANPRGRARRRAGCWSATISASARRRAGDFAFLATQARQPRASSVECDADTCRNGGVRVSSTAVREALARGDLDARARAARAGLQHQRARGARRQAGARARISHRQRPAQAQPPAADGDLRGRGATASAASRCPAWRASACGRRCKRRGKPVLEVHLFDFTGDIYGRALRVDVPAQAARRGEVPRPRHADCAIAAMRAASDS